MIKESVSVCVSLGDFAVKNVFGGFTVSSETLSFWRKASSLAEDVGQPRAHDDLAAGYPPSPFLVFICS